MIYQVFLCFLRFLLLFCCCTIKCNHLHMPVTFLWTRSTGTRLSGHVTRFKMEKKRFKMALQRIFAQSFPFQIFPHLFTKLKNKWVDHTFTKPKGKFFMEFTLSSKYSRKCNRFSIMIINKLHADATEGRGLKWCIKLDKRFVLIYFYWLHKIGSCSTLHFLCCYANYLTKTKGSVYNAHLDFRGKICVKKVRIIHG